MLLTLLAGDTSWVNCVVKSSERGNMQGQPYDRDVDDGRWTPRASSSMTKTSTRTYTAPDGSTITEVSKLSTLNC